MAKNVNAVNVINWEHSENFLRRSDGLQLSHPSSLLTWVDNMKWPEVIYGDIFNYFVLSGGVDGAATKNYKITEAYQYLHCGKVDRVLLHSEGDFVFLKANVQPSQSSSPSHSLRSSQPHFEMHSQASRTFFYLVHLNVHVTVRVQSELI